MKKFLSYLFTFITVFAISTTLTIRIKSNMIDNSRPVQNASASSETTLLSGLLSGLEENPKLDISGNVDVVIDGKPLSIALSVQADLTTITSPSVKGNVIIEFNGNTLDALFTYNKGNIFLSYKNIKFSASVDSIKDIIDIFKNVTKGELVQEEGELADTAQLSDGKQEDENAESTGLNFNLDLDALVNALNEPKRTIVDDDYIYEVNLQGLCKLTLVCDSKFNIKSADIRDFQLIEGIDLTASLNVIQDENLVISDPANADEHLNLQAITHAIETLKNRQYLRLNAWAAVYKQNVLVQYLDAYGKVDIKNNKAIINASLNGAIDAKLGINYLNDTLYANFNNLYLSADKTCFTKLKDLVDNSDINAGDIIQGLTTNTAGIIEWLENNYSTLLDTAIIDNTQVKLVADLNGLFGQTGEVSFVINLNGGLVSSIQLSGLNIGEYKIKLTIYIDSPDYLDFKFETDKYYDANKLVDILGLVLNLDKANVDANLNLSTGKKQYAINANVIADITSKAILGNVSINDTLVSLGLKDNTIYANYDEVYAKISTGYIVDLLNEFTNGELGNVKNLTDIVKKLSINDILTLLNLTSDANGIYLNTDLSALLGTDLKLNIKLDYNDNRVVLNLSITAGSINVAGDITLGSTDQEIIIDENKYIDVQPFVDNIINLVKDTNYAGTIDVAYGELTITGNYNLSYKNVDGKHTINASVNGSLCGLPLSLHLVDETVYIALDNLKVSMPLSEIDNLLAWINTNFGTNLSLESLKNNLSTTEFNISDLTNLLLTDNGLSLNYKDMQIVLGLKDQVSAKIENDKFSVDLTLEQSSSDISVNTSEYLPYTSVTNLVDSIIKLVKDKQIALSGNAEVYEGNTLHYSATATVQVDLNKPAFYGEVSVRDHTNNTVMPFMIAYTNGMWYVDYNNLKVKINKNDLNEILVVLLELVGVDPSLVPFLKDVANGMDVDVGNISNLVPNIDFNNPLGMIKYLSGIGFDGNSLELSIDSKLISEQGKGDMLIKLDTDGERLTRVKLDNLYTGVTLDEKFNLDVTVTSFSGVSDPYSGNYIDLSGANELIKAIINTAELNFFEIDGSLTINGNLIGIDINWNVPVNIKVKLDENRKPEIMATIGEIPAVIGINNDVPYKFGDTESGSGRMLYIYYKDEYVYFYRREYVNIMFGAGKRTYEKKLKAHISTVLSDPLYYLQYGVGFTNTIIDAIQQSLDKGKGHTPDLGNIINSFEVVDSRNYNVQLNMKELTNDPAMGTMDIGLGVVNNEQTNGKNYVGTASFSLYMPIVDAFKLTLSSDNLTLINIGKTLDFDELYTYINNYSYAVNEEWEASNGSWSKASEREITINFETNGGAAVDNITGKVDDPITLPTLPDKVEINSASGERITYGFAGWYTSSSLKEASKFTQTTMPRRDTTLYAKWSVIKTEKIVTITFNSNGGTAYDSVSDLQGSAFNLGAYNPTKQLTFIKGDYNWFNSHAGKWTYTVTRYTFAGWYTDSTFKTKFTDNKMPSESITLYAKWTETVTTEYYLAGQEPK